MGNVFALKAMMAKIAPMRHVPTNARPMGFVTSHGATVLLNGEVVIAPSGRAPPHVQRQVPAWMECASASTDGLGTTAPCACVLTTVPSMECVTQMGHALASKVTLMSTAL